MSRSIRNKRYEIICFSLLGLMLFANCNGSAGSGTSTLTLQGALPAAADSSMNPNLRMAVTPNSVLIKLYALAVSTDEFCSDPITIFSNDEPTLVDLADNPTFGSGEVPDGTYPCVILEIADTFTYTPEATDGACVEGEESSKGVCDESPTLLLDGTTPTCTDGEDRVAVYMSTANTNETPEDWDAAGCDNDDVDCNGFVPPTAEVLTRGGALGSALVVDGDHTGTFVVDLTDGLEAVTNEDAEEECSIEDIRFSFE
jgi:hypothetical protein